jgi:hypothetical protein
MKKIDITKEALLADGWIEVKEDLKVVHLEKLIPNRNPINSCPDDTDIKLILHSFFNQPAFAVFMPDGSMLNFVANSMKDLRKFESMINFYDCPY